MKFYGMNFKKMSIYKMNLFKSPVKNYHVTDLSCQESVQGADIYALDSNKLHTFHFGVLEKVLFRQPLKYLLIFLLFYSGLACARDTLVSEEVYHKISDSILSGKYSEAEDEADRFIREHPGEPAGPLFKASVLQYKYIDYEDHTGNDEFYRLLDETVNLARNKIKLDSDDLWAHYYLNAAHGLIGARASVSGRLLYGIAKGRSGAKGMLRIVEKDSTFYDALLMTGSYHFWKSVAIAHLTWLPFISDEREQGIAEVEKAISHGRLNGPLSGTVLLEMLLEYDPESAVKLAEEMVESYPDCRLFAWQLGEAYKKMKLYDDAVRVFTGIADSMKEDEADDGSGELRCWWKLAVLSKSVGKKDECIYFCRKIIGFMDSESVYKRQRERIGRALNMIEELSDE